MSGKQFQFYLLYSILVISGVIVEIAFAAKIKDNKTSGFTTIAPNFGGTASSTSSSSLDNSNNNNNLGIGPECSARQFRCNSGVCIQISYVCDGDPDCSDSSDEDPEHCKNTETTCSESQFRCKVNGRCIPKHWQCDQERDCSDGSDEDPKYCQIKKCTNEEYACRSADGECIPLAWMCDGARDCKDGSDEHMCNETCRSDEFTCNNGRCIQNRWLCDQDDDCGDNSDERSCPPTTCAPEKQFACSSSHCISARWRCDGDLDCADGSDEKNCTDPADPQKPEFSKPKGTICLSSEYKCNDRISCIKNAWVCDGQKDCPGGDDEMPPICRNVTCRADQFQCRDQSCIPGHLHCSGKPDCSDGSDEVNCSDDKVPAKCNPKKEFDCGGGMCIPLSKVCDGEPNCPEFQDEPVDKCNKNECLKNNGGCRQICHDAPIGYYCDCIPGYKLIDNKTCDDINECEEFGSCSQRCVNEKGTFKCECEAGYMRDPRDHTRCKATEGHASLLFARRHDIRKISLDHREMTSIVNETKSATALDYVFRTGMIFWSDVTEQRIYKAPIDEGNEKKVVLTNQSITSDGLAVDWIYNHIYFTNTLRLSIEVANFDGGMHKILLTDELEMPRSIALDPIDGWMYWTDWGTSTPKIERAGMDGTHRKAIVTYDVKWPNGLTLDLVKKRVYWVDGKLNTISAVNYDGSGRVIVLYSPDTLRHPFSITVFEDSVYWTDWDKEAVYKANKFTGKNVEPVTSLHMVQHPMTIHVYHPYRQPEGVNQCQSLNGHCSHFCLPAPRITVNSPKISCACPEGLVLVDDLTCNEDVNYTTKSPNPKTKTKPSINDNRNKSERTDGGTTVDSTSTFKPSASIEHHSSNIYDNEDDGTKKGGSTSGQNTPSGHFPNETIVPQPIPSEYDSGAVAIVVIAIVTFVVIILGFVTYLLYRHYVHRNLTSMNFDNPVYRKTTEDQFSLEKNLPNRIYPSTVGDEAQAREPLNKPSTNDFVEP